MIVADVGKLVILCVIAAGLLVGLILGRIEGEAWGLLGMIVGYLTGNGVAAVRKSAPMPTIRAELGRQEAAAADAERKRRSR